MVQATLRFIAIVVAILALCLVALCLTGNAQTHGSEAALLVRIQQLEAEVADLRLQLLARDAAKLPTPAQAKIVMQSIVGCDACEQWYAAERPKLVATGWVVERESVTTWPLGRKFPRWRVCVATGCTEIENCSATQFMERLRAIVGKKY